MQYYLYYPIYTIPFHPISFHHIPPRTIPPNHNQTIIPPYSITFRHKPYYYIPYWSIWSYTIWHGYRPYYRQKAQFLYASKVLSQSDAFHTILRNQMPCNWILYTLLLNPTNSIPTSYHTIPYHPIKSHPIIYQPKLYDIIPYHHPMSSYTI